MQIKRGETLITPGRKKQLAPWQYIENDYYGQVILALHLQMPGTARSGKRNIFSMNGVYESIFKRNAVKVSIIDTLKIFRHYVDYVDYQIANDLFTDPDTVNVATNGRFIIPSIIGFMIKEKRGLLNTTKINDGDKEWENEVIKDCLNDKGLFIDSLPDDYTEILFDLFTEIISEVVSLYQTREKEEKTVSNFFKTDQKYYTVILKHITNKYYRQKIKERNLKRDYLKIFQ
jgi:hypothetical protein